MSTHIEIEVLLPDIATLNKFADFCMTEFGNKPDIDTCLMTAELILRSHGDMVVLREFI